MHTVCEFCQNMLNCDGPKTMEGAEQEAKRSALAFMPQMVRAGARSTL